MNTEYLANDIKKKRLAYLIKRLFQVLKMSKINGLIYDKLVKPSKSVPLPSYEQALSYLNACSPNPNSSCIHHNVLSKNPKYNLQIIIPVYNAEKYIEDCMDSVLAQDTKYSYKVVVINDGSPDNSREILKKYENLPNVEIIDQENKGFSGARNTGLSYIDAKYIAFVDSDDILPPNTVETFMKYALETDADIVAGSYKRIKNGKLIKGKTQTLNMNQNPDALPGFCWTNIYNAQIWENLKFPENYWYEDTINSMIIYKMIKQAVSIPDIIYLYRVNPRSISHIGITKPKAIDTLWIIEAMLKDAKRLGIMDSDETKNREFRTFLKQCQLVNSRLFYFNDDIKTSAFVLLREWLNTYFNVDESQCEELNSIKVYLITNDYDGFYKHCFVKY